MYLFPFFTPHSFLNTTHNTLSSSTHKILENKDNVTIEIEALGRELSEIEVNIRAHKLHIELPQSSLLPEKSQVQKTVWQELSLDAKSYVFTLGTHIDLSRTEASLKNGKLLINIYKKEEEVHSIPVKSL